MPTAQPTPKKPKNAQNFHGSTAGNVQSGQTAETYEQQAEVMAIKRLLDSKHFHNAALAGSGHGYLYSLVSHYADAMTLVSQKASADYTLASQNHSTGQDNEMTHKLSYANGSIDLVVMVRFLRQFADPSQLFAELARILAPDGVAIIEVAHYIPGHQRKHRLHRRLKVASADENMETADSKVALHDPRQVIRELSRAGLKVERILSVSSLQGTGLKKVMPHRVLLAVEGLLQPALGRRYHGPSVFLAVRKIGV